MPRTAVRRPRYQPHPLLEMAQRGKEKIRLETGRTFEQWVALGRAKGPKGRRDLSAWLRRQHGLKNMVAHWVAGAVLSPDTDYGDPEPLVDALYSGRHAALRPLHEAVVDMLVALGDDVTVTACKTMVPAYRKHVFAELAPTAGGVEVQMSLGRAAFKGRLARAAGRAPDDRLSHAVVLRTAKDVDAELEAWLRQAYALGAEKIVRSTAFAIPADLGKPLARSKPASATWASMTPAMRRDMVTWITSAKQATTRARRVAAALAKLSAGERRVY